jgi:hypothetical protein
MEPYQAYRRGLITLEQYTSQKLKGNIDIDDTLSRPVVMMGIIGLEENEVWTIEAQETAIGFIGPSGDLTNEGNMVINGDVLFQCIDNGIDSNTGDITVSASGSLTLNAIS